MTQTMVAAVNDLQCPRCEGSSRVEELGTTLGSLWMHCGACGHVWRYAVSGVDPFALILASQAVSPPGRGERRAPRFLIHLFARYRLPRRPEWHNALTENISQSGVLLRTHELVPVGTLVELTLVLPGRVAGDPETRIRSEGEVVRAEPEVTSDSQAAVAVTVRGYQISTS